MVRDDEQLPEEEQAHAFWSGIIAFGLVSLPVSLFPARRGNPASLKMVDAQGALLKRQFFCSKDDRPLEREEIVRGYEIEHDRYVVVEDDELAALEPEKSREIDLKRFVPLDAINPIYFERAYFLVPDGDTTKAYRLLARSMEEERKAGIATFVMRGREYLVAIIAEHGILRAETLRFHDELRSPEDVGLPERKGAEKKALARMRAAIRKVTHRRFDREQLSDPHTRELMRRIDKKLKSGKDVLPAPEEPEAEALESNVIDLLQVLRERLQARQPRTMPGNNRLPSRGKRQQTKVTSLDRRSKEQLYAEAQRLDIPGRSKMSREQLIAEIARAHAH